MLPSPLPDRAQAQAHRLLSSGDDDECRKFIRENNIDMDLPNAQGCTLLITACAFDRSTLLHELVARTNNIAAATYANANNALHFAALSTHPDVLRLLLEADVDKWQPWINVGNANGDTPLMVACTTKCVQAVDALLLHGADVTASNKDRVTALMCAAKEACDSPPDEAVQLVGRLLATRDVASTLNATNVDGNTALHFAVQSRRPNVVRILLSDI
ncbi:hypothetical protein AaE_004636 [Aphanomyces astaci]|uniref:Uncharacterized protein n=1 Tax=Aphanomyces astaci TaxID=112090 RepID=A0A6A5ANF5_APHAT|nr:hypothetical protein AaE_004636 [Aphanomyces astaci]